MAGFEKVSKSLQALTNVFMIDCLDEFNNGATTHPLLDQHHISLMLKDLGVNLDTGADRTLPLTLGPRALSLLSFCMR